MTLCPILVDVRNAYEAHDREALERALARIQAMLARSTSVRHLDPVALTKRRELVLAELATIDDEIQRRHADDSARQRRERDEWLRQQPKSLDQGA